MRRSCDECIHIRVCSDTVTSADDCEDYVNKDDITPIRHGHWIAEYDCGYTTPHCSECGEIALTKEETSYDYVYSSYCPHCGAKMDEKKCNSK